MHISFQKLTDYVADRLTHPHDRQAIAAHIHHCDECRQALAIAIKLSHRRSAEEDNEPPASLIQRVLKATQQQVSHKELRHLVATLLYDSKLAAVAPGVRGAMQDRELLFAFGHFDLHLSVVRNDQMDTYTLLGQLMRAEGHEGDIEGSCIELYQEDTRLRTALTDSFGCFRLSRLPKGYYRMTLTVGQLTTTIDAFPLCTTSTESSNETLVPNSYSK